MDRNEQPERILSANPDLLKAFTEARYTIRRGADGHTQWAENPAQHFTASFTE